MIYTLRLDYADDTFEVVELAAASYDDARDAIGLDADVTYLGFRHEQPEVCLIADDLRWSI